MIHRISAGQDDGRVLGQVDSLLSEILRLHAFYVDEWTEINGQFLTVGQVEVRNFSVVGFGCEIRTV